MKRFLICLPLMIAAIPAHAEDVSPARLRADVETLVGFGTRHTMSSDSGSLGIAGSGPRGPGHRRSFAPSARSVAAA
jgi:hypothetical protein